MREYVPLLMMIGFVAFNAVLLVALSQLLSPRRRTAIKGAPYESGMPPLGGTRERFSVKFYLVALVFVLAHPLLLAGLRLPSQPVHL